MSIPSDQRPAWQRYARAIGIAIGFIPVVVAWIALGLGLKSGGGTLSAVLIYVVLALYAVEILAAVALLLQQQLRPVGQGLLIMVFAGPVVWAVGCTVELSTVHG